MPVTKKTIENIRWPDDASVEPDDTFLAIVIQETPRSDKMDSPGMRRDVLMLGTGFETIADVADELLHRLRTDAVEFDPGWARITKTDGVVDFGTDTYDPQQ